MRRRRAQLDTSQAINLSVNLRTQVSPSAHGYAGPFRLQSTGGNYHRYSWMFGTSESLQLGLRLLHDPKSLSLAVSSVRLTEAQSDDGRSLLFANARISPQGRSNLAGLPYFDLSLPLKAIDRRGGKIKVLKGVLSLDMIVRPRQRLIVPDLAKAQGRTYFGEEGRRLTFLQAQQFGNQWNLFLNVAGPPSWKYDPKRCGFELVDARGRSLRLPQPLQGYVRTNAVQPEDTAWLAAAPLAPSLLTVPWTAFAAQAYRPVAGLWQGSLWINSGEPLKTPVRLRMFDCETLHTELPFELRDVPLP